MKLLAAGYGRTNDTPCAAQDMERQKAAVTAYCRAHGLTLTAFYADPAASGLHLRRTGLQALLEGAKKRKFEVVVAWDTQVLCRRLVDLYRLQAVLRENGVSLLLCRDDRQSAFLSESGQLQEYAPPKE